MNFLSVDYFLAVSRNRSFTKAAAELHITQQTLSTHIANLEKELGTPLFQRHIPLDLTHAGEVFLRHAKLIQSSYHQMQHEMSDLSGNPMGILRIGIAHTRGRGVLPHILNAFQKEYPNIQIEADESTNEVLRQKLDSGNVDLVIARFPEKIPRVTIKEFYTEEMALLISDKLADELFGDEKDLALSQIPSNFGLLKDCPFLVNPIQDIAGQVAYNLFAQAGFVPKVRFMSENIETLLNMNVLGMGASFCPTNLIDVALTKEEKASLHILHLNPDSCTYPIHFGYKTQSYTWEVINNFMRIASETYSSKL